MPTPTLFDKIAANVLDNWLDTKQEHATNKDDCAADCWCRAPLEGKSAPAIVAAHEGFVTREGDDVETLWTMLDVYRAGHLVEETLRYAVDRYIILRVNAALASMVCNPEAVPVRRTYALETKTYPRWESDVYGYDDDVPRVRYFLID
jgi:hypothetical protein